MKISEFNKDLAESRLIEMGHYIGCLHSEEAITTSTYNYLFDMTIYLLNSIVREIDVKPEEED